MTAAYSYIKKYCSTLLLLIFPVFLSGQVKEDFQYFIDQAVGKLYTNSQLSIEFAQDISNNDKNPDNKILYRYITSQSFALQGDYLNSVKTFLTNEGSNTKNHSKFHSFYIEYCLADQFQNLGLYEQSQNTISHLLERKKFPEHPETQITLAKIYQLQAINFAVVKQFPEAFQYLYKSNSFIKDSDEENKILKVENQLFEGVFLINQKKLTEADVLFNKVLKNKLLQKYNFLYALAKENASRVRFLQQRHQESIALLLDAKRKIEGKHYIILESKIYEGLSKAYIAQNNNLQYQNYRSLFEKIKQKSDNSKKTAISYLVNAIEDVNKEDLTFFEAEADQKMNLTLIGCVFLILGFGSVYWYNSKKQKDLTKQIDFFEKFVTKSSNQKALPNTISLTEASSNEVGSKRTSLLSAEKEKELLDKLNQFENSQLYLSNQMSLSVLAAELDTNIKYLSEILRKYKDKKFNAYINDLRIQYVVNLLKSDAAYLNYKVSYLAEISGFSSHSAFTAVFKSITGMSPNDFIQQISPKK